MTHSGRQHLTKRRCTCRIDENVTTLVSHVDTPQGTGELDPHVLRVVSKQLFVPKHKLDIDKHAFSVAVPTISNQLPITIKSSETIATFRRQFKT